MAEDIDTELQAISEKYLIILLLMKTLKARPAFVLKRIRRDPQ